MLIKVLLKEENGAVKKLYVNVRRRSECVDEFFYGLKSEHVSCKVCTGFKLPLQGHNRMATKEPCSSGGHRQSPRCVSMGTYSPPAAIRGSAIVNVSSAHAHHRLHQLREDSDVG